MATLGIRQEFGSERQSLAALSHLATEIQRQLKINQIAINQKSTTLEKRIQAVSSPTAIADGITRLQGLADEIRELTRARKFYQLNQAIATTANAIKAFPETCCQAIPVDVFEAVNTGVQALENSLDLISNASEQLNLIEDLSEDSSLKQLRNWTTYLEILAEELEDHLPFLSAEVFDCLERLAETIVLKSRKRGADARTTRESYRRRLRFAAGFILNLVETAREEALEEDEAVLQDMQLLGRKTLNALYEDDEVWNLVDQNLVENI